MDDGVCVLQLLCGCGASVCARVWWRLKPLGEWQLFPRVLTARGTFLKILNQQRRASEGMETCLQDKPAVFTPA